MKYKELILHNPLMQMGYETDDILTEGGFGAVLARAGVGKTAFLVQIALHSMLKNKNALHISLIDPVKKVNLWYREVIHNLGEKYKMDETDRLWDTIIPHRLIMSFKVEGFSAPKLEQRITELIEQNIFSPQMIIIDGLPFDKSVRDSLLDLKAFAKKYSAHVWFAIRTHRHERPRPDGMPPFLLEVSDLFEVVIRLQPQGKDIYIESIKGGPPAANHPPLLLDPASMLITPPLSTLSVPKPADGNSYRFPLHEKSIKKPPVGNKKR